MRNLSDSGISQRPRLLHKACRWHTRIPTISSDWVRHASGDHWNIGGFGLSKIVYVLVCPEASEHQRLRQAGASGTNGMADFSSLAMLRDLGLVSAGEYAKTWPPGHEVPDWCGSLLRLRRYGGILPVTASEGDFQNRGFPTFLLGDHPRGQGFP